MFTTTVRRDVCDDLMPRTPDYRSGIATCSAEGHRSGWLFANLPRIRSGVSHIQSFCYRFENGAASVRNIITISPTKLWLRTYFIRNSIFGSHTFSK